MSHPIKDPRLTVVCPSCEDSIPVDPGHTIETAVAAHDRHCPGTRTGPGGNRSRRVECPLCRRHLADIGPSAPDRDEQISRLHALHACKPTTRPAPPAPVKGPARMPVTTPTPTLVQRRPPAQHLLQHPCKRVARQAAKVLAEESRLTKAWKEDLSNARIREQIAAEEAEIAARQARVKALRDKMKQGGSSAGKPAGTVDLTSVRRWAHSNGVDVPATGRISQQIIDQYLAATKAAS